jgi:hypothetical protein
VGFRHPGGRRPAERPVQLANITAISWSGIPDSNWRPSAWEQVEGLLISDEAQVSTGSEPSRDVSRCLVLTRGGGTTGGTCPVRPSARPRAENALRIHRPWPLRPRLRSSLHDRAACGGLENHSSRARRLHPHEELSAVGAPVDDLGGRVSVRGPVHLVLHRREELLSSRRAAVDFDRMPRRGRPVSHPSLGQYRCRSRRTRESSSRCDATECSLRCAERVRVSRRHCARPCLVLHPHRRTSHHQLQHQWFSARP